MQTEDTDSTLNPIFKQASKLPWTRAELPVRPSLPFPDAMTAIVSLADGTVYLQWLLPLSS